MMRIVGYTDRASVRAGERIGCHVSLLADSAQAEADYHAAMVRVVGVEPALATERVEPVAGLVEGTYAATVQATAVGSHGRACLGDAVADATGLRLGVALMSTLPNAGEQGLLSVCATTRGALDEVSLALGPDGRPAVSFHDARTGALRFELSVAVETGRWYEVSGGHRDGEAFLELFDVASGEAHRATWPLPRVPPLADAAAFLACRPVLDGDRLRASDCFTGRLEDPFVAAPDGPVATWDLALDPASFALRDASGHGHHGELYGLPTRLVTGSAWDGRAASPSEAPEQYRAVDFHADAIEDADWPVAFSVEIPADLPSGVYAFTLTSHDDVDTVPFVVAPAPTSERADVLLVLPTATYMAYGNARFAWEKVNYEIQCERTVELGRGEAILLDHPELGASSYDQHEDGQNISLVSWRRPNLDMRAAQHRSENYSSDLHLIDWLERRGRRYDVITDGDLDRLGREALDPHRVVLTGTHPEYASTACHDALQGYVADGGRLVVLGGNAFHFLVAFSPDRPWIMEVRKSDNRPAGSRAAAEGHLALTGEFSADPDAPRPSERFLGSSTASMGFDESRPYERLPASDEPATAFVFAGVEARVIETDATHADVVFQEWDNGEDVAGFAFGPGRPTVLARSTRHSVNTRWFGATKRRNHAEMTMFTTDAGGAVFSAGSMGWCRALRSPAVSRITANVVERFADSAPFASSSGSVPNAETFHHREPHQS